MSEKTMIFGTHAVLETLKEGKPIDQILIKKQSDNEIIREIIFHARKAGVTVKSVPVEKLQRITQKNHQGVIAFTSPIEFDNIEILLPTIYERGETPFIVLLDEVSDVRNFGAIVRSCECMGVHAVVVPHVGSAQISADALKTSAGALAKVPVCKVKSLAATCKYLQESGLQLLCASEKFAEPCYEVDMTMPTALVMGNEEQGISQPIIDLADRRICIPMTGEINSLNVSVATGICLYEVARQRMCQ
ncbi:MAG: 23S rRNA (guanosine(2251)-2'-O)-methyltransferase RlmB [Bacteroidetes bacterium]|nr:23S rRNA (guanosine(2251)-2'-O)-methyltransferase RlmB [Bacteroidota bacterium]MCL2329421.1 23S rRNA (guanosine(2251)-2'-O)-methyltransferase RlmB [Bacteroidota bacterium]